MRPRLDGRPQSLQYAHRRYLRDGARGATCMRRLSRRKGKRGERGATCMRWLSRRKGKCGARGVMRLRWFGLLACGAWLLLVCAGCPGGAAGDDAHDAAAVVEEAPTPGAGDPPAHLLAGDGADMRVVDRRGADAPPERIVSILPNVTELVAALGEERRLVARSVHCDYPPHLSALPSIGSGMSPDIESILALEPDIVIGGAWQDRPEIVETLRRRGVEVLLLPEARLSDLPAALRTLGHRLDAMDRAEALLSELDAGLDAVSRRVAVAVGESPPRALHVVGRDPVVVAGPETFLGELHLRLGLALQPQRGAWVHMDAETLHLQRSDLLVEAGTPEEVAARWARPGGPALCAIDPNVAVRPGPRLVQAAEQLAGCVEALR